MLTTYMAVTMAFGFCSAVGLLYGPVHNILPLLMIGLGVDDMFVIVQCWQNLDHQVGTAMVTFIHQQERIILFVRGTDVTLICTLLQSSPLLVGVIFVQHFLIIKSK